MTFDITQSYSGFVANSRRPAVSPIRLSRSPTRRPAVSPTRLSRVVSGEGDPPTRRFADPFPPQRRP